MSEYETTQEPVRGWGTCPVCLTETTEDDERAEFVHKDTGNRFLGHAECYLQNRDEFELA